MHIVVSNLALTPFPPPPPPLSLTRCYHSRCSLTGSCFLQCVGTLSRALGSLWKPHAQALLESMMLTGLSDILVSSLTQVSFVWIGLSSLCLDCLQS